MLKKPNQNYLYSFKYDYHHFELSKLESRQIFNSEEENKILFSTTRIDPSISPYIKCRLEIISSSEDYTDLLSKIENEKIKVEGFKIEYLLLDNDTTDFDGRRKRMKDIGFRIEGEPDFKTPSITYSICNFENCWYFGILKNNNSEWRNHKQKPCSFSNSISMNIAKSLVSIASTGNKNIKLLDACCGVGTIMLEACFAGFNIDGSDVNWNACEHAKENLEHYNYTANVFNSDVKDLKTKYDAAIIDLPYNLYSYSNDTITTNIIESVVKLASRIIIVSISDIKTIINESGLSIIDFCTVEKRGKSKFTRNIWVCEKNNN